MALAAGLLLAPIAVAVPDFVRGGAGVLALVELLVFCVCAAVALGRA